MLIRNTYTDPTINNDLFNDFNIKKNTRKILLFIDRDEYNTKSVKFGKAIQINTAVQTEIVDDAYFTIGLRTKNNATIKNNVYFYSVIFDSVLGMSDIKKATFILNDAYSTENIEDYDTKVTSRPFVGIYDKEFSSDSSRVEQVSEMFYNNSSVPLPKYYTSRQQDLQENDQYSINWLDFTIQYEGYELIDNVTSITVYDIKMWDTMNYNINSPHIDSFSNKERSTDMIGDLFIDSVQPMINGFVFIYDTDDGYCVKKNPMVTDKLPMYEFRQKEQIVDDLQQIITNLDNQAKMIYNTHGPVRIHYAPFMHGDKIEVIFKDYDKNNQPADYNKANIDKGIVAKDHMAMLYEEITMLRDDGA